MNDSEGELAVRIARQAVEAEAKGHKAGNIDAPASFREKRGVFVTLHSYPSHMLRGCIGFPEPVFSLASALLQVADAACHDPRFDDLQVDELDSIIVEVSVLTPPVEIRVEDRKKLPGQVHVGQDGLIAEFGHHRGLLLPQVAIEWEWNAEEFLEQTCVKAGLTADMWLDPRTKLFKFQGEIFSESSPSGQVVRKKLS
jgi:uncharacterized protein